MEHGKLSGPIQLWEKERVGFHKGFHMPDWHLNFFRTRERLGSGIMSISNVQVKLGLVEH
jgi:hypothetical protein